MSAPPRPRAALRGGLLGALAASLLGCYAYAPVEPGAPRPGDEVRATISEEEARRLDRADLLAAGNVLEGVVEEVTEDSLLVAVRRQELRGIERFGSARDTVRLAIGNVRRMETQRMQPLRTAAVAVAGGGGMVLFFALLFEGASQGGDDGGPQEPRLMLKLPLHR